MSNCQAEKQKHDCEFEEFKKDFRRARLLQLSLPFVMENRVLLETQLANATESNDELFGQMTMDQITYEAVEATSAGVIFFLQHAIEEYSRNAHGGHDGTASRVEKCTPSFTLKCHSDHPSEHVLFITGEIRDSIIHSRPKYNNLKCDWPPFKLLLQQVGVVDKDRRRIILHKGNDTKTQFLERTRRNDCRRIMSFGELLAEEVYVCIKMYDAVKSKTEAAIIKAMKAAKLPLEYA